MKKFLEKLKKHKVKFIVIAVIVVVAIIAIIFVNKKKAEALSQLHDMVDTETIERTDVTNYVAMTGTIVANDSQTVYSTQNGLKVLEVLVDVGSEVKEGDVIAVLDSTQYEEQLETAKRKLAVDEALRDLEIKIAQETLYETKLDGLDNWKHGITDVAEANTDMTYSQIEYQQACEDLSQARADLRYEVEKLEEDLEEARKDEKDAPSGSVSRNAAKEKRKDLEEKLDNLDHTFRSEYNSIVSAERGVQKAEQSIERQQRTINDTAEKFADSAEEARRRNLDAEENLQKENLQASVATDAQEDEVKKLQDQVDECVIKAPMSGVVTSVLIEEGDETGTDNNTICVIQDVSGYKVEGTIDEYDISKIYEGMTATVKTEATGDVEMTGKVSFVSPTPVVNNNSSGQSSSSAADYKVKVTLDNITEDVRIGMTAQTSIVLEEAKDVLAVPYDCILEKEDGTFAVYVVSDEMDGKKPEKPEKNMDEADQSDMGSGFSKGREYIVTKGVETDYMIEISANGLEEGMEVYVVGDADEDEMMNFGGGFMGGPGPR